MEFTIEESGAKVILNPCGLQQAFKLKAEIEKQLLAHNLDLKNIDFEDMASVVPFIMAIDSSEHIFDLFFDCLKTSSYNNLGIKKETFDTPEKWGDLYEIFFYCLKVNIYPFFKNLLFKLKKLGQETTTDDQEPKYPTV